MPSNHTSGQAWAYRPDTWYRPSSRRSPGVKPTATRAGIPINRAMAANVAENCSQYPVRISRNWRIASLPWPRGTSRLYVNVSRKKDCRARALA